MAARLLRETNDTIEDIMLQAGFHSDSHFYNAFRRLFGMSPRDYRQTT
jgi:AraC-like DNA-binding protein